MAENKTRPTGASVSAFLAALEPEQRRSDAAELAEMLTEATGEEAEPWGTSIIGYGRTTVEESGSSWFRIGFSPRKTNLVLYSTTEQDPKLLATLGKHKTGVGCLHIAKLNDIDRGILRSLIEESVRTR